MNRKLILALAAATAFTVSIAGASAEPAPRQAGASPATAAPLSPTLARIGKPAAAPVSPMPGAGFSALTAEECKKLGGAVYTAPQCKKTGTRCVMRLEGGQVNAPCIDEVS